MDLTGIREASAPLYDKRDTLSEPFWSPAESDALSQRLWRLLERQMRLKTQGDSASLRVEEVAELTQSIQFTLRLHLDACHLPQRALLAGDETNLLKQAQATLRRLVADTKRLYDQAERTVRSLGSVSLRDTLEGIGGFFTRYDERLFAHCIPAEIDYQLCHPVPETLLGVRYIREYLTRLLIENELILRLDPLREQALLTRASPGYRDLLLNLYEPVAANIVGLTLLGGGETLLEMTVAQADWLSGMICALPAPQARDRLSAAAAQACRKLGLTGEASQRYLADTAVQLYPRLSASPEAARGVFNVR